MKKRKIMAIVAIMAAISITGCSSSNKEVAPLEKATTSEESVTEETGAEETPANEDDSQTIREVKTAEDLAHNYAISAGHDNFHMEGTMSLSVSVAAGDSGEETMVMPMSVSVSEDVMGSLSKGSVDMETTLFGESQTNSMNTYSDGSYSYVCEGDTVTKTPTEFGDTSGVDYTSMAEIPTDLFANGDLSISDDGQTYSVTISMLDMLNNKDAASIFENTGVTDGINEDDFVDGLSTAYVVYTFDKDYNLTSLVCDQVTVNSDSTEGDASYKIAMTFGFAYNFSNFGNITEEDVTIPQEVIDSAEDVSALESTDDVDTSLPEEEDAAPEEAPAPVSVEQQ